MTDTVLNLLIVEDEDDFRESCARWMQRKGHRVTAVGSGAEALGLCETQDFDVAVFDMNMPGMSGLELLQRVHTLDIPMEVIILTGQGTIETAVASMKLGACDFLTKPCSLGDLEHHCLLASNRGQLRKENRQLKALISRQRPAMDLIGDSPAMNQISRLITKVAPTDKPVLIQGESGTGKEVVARAIQQNSLLADKPFVTINCAALPEQLVESELFGHQKGAFTGAVTEKPGLFEIADGGTLFIDEIGELPLSLQPKLLRVLEDGSMRRIGSHKERIVKVRIIAATNRNLTDEVKEGNFREDLFYRINVLSLQLPPLRERAGDVDRLVDHFTPAVWQVDDAVRAALNRCPWPGNVRQLINVLQRAMILADGNEITIDDLPAEIVDGRAGRRIDPGSPSQLMPLDAAATSRRTGMLSTKLDDIAKAHVLEVLAAEKNNKARAARKLGIHRRKLYRLLDRFAKDEAADSSKAECELAPNEASPAT
ncbi:sigma-54-dependent transcriptional regulator [Planctomycetes bacterium K23_9]|uniref:Nitrogen regulation protein NR(I) n=1 Tax=Stieleria marina TaxID=1930275 RepID=A0A517NQV3_9BACT|nr:Nitrogen regulation protein NR(I) [Planctomycetes bacterium K23_9]